MATSWYEKVKEFKSPTRVITAVLLRSRETQAAKVCELSQRIAELQSQLDQQQQQLQQCILTVMDAFAKTVNHSDARRKQESGPSRWGFVDGGATVTQAVGLGWHRVATLWRRKPQRINVHRPTRL